MSQSVSLLSKQLARQPIGQEGGRQSVRQAGRQTVGWASRQTNRNTQFGFSQWQTRLQAVGRTSAVTTSCGRMVMQPATDVHVGASYRSWRIVGSAGRPVSSAQSDPRSNPSEHKLLTPPPPQSDIKFQGRPQNQKIHGGIVLLDKIMILQRVGHQTSCLGVCNANDPPKGGV